MRQRPLTRYIGSLLYGSSAHPALLLQLFFQYYMPPLVHLHSYFLNNIFFCSMSVYVIRGDIISFVLTYRLLMTLLILLHRYRGYYRR